MSEQKPPRCKHCSRRLGKRDRGETCQKCRELSTAFARAGGKRMSEHAERVDIAEVAEGVKALDAFCPHSRYQLPRVNCLICVLTLNDANRSEE